MASPALLDSPSAFRDPHARRSYLRAREVARRIVADPSLIENGRAFLERHVRGDPGQFEAYRTWTALLRCSPREISEAMTGLDTYGEALRASAPVFCVLSRDEVALLWEPSS